MSDRMVDLLFPFAGAGGFDRFFLPLFRVAAKGDVAMAGRLPGVAVRLYQDPLLVDLSQEMVTDAPVPYGQYQRILREADDLVNQWVGGEEFASLDYRGISLPRVMEREFQLFFICVLYSFYQLRAFVDQEVREKPLILCGDQRLVHLYENVCRDHVTQRCANKLFSVSSGFMAAARRLRRSLLRFNKASSLTFKIHRRLSSSPGQRPIFLMEIGRAQAGFTANAEALAQKGQSILLWTYRAEDAEEALEKDARIFSEPIPPSSHAGIPFLKKVKEALLQRGKRPLLHQDADLSTYLLAIGEDFLLTLGSDVLRLIDATHHVFTQYRPSGVVIGFPWNWLYTTVLQVAKLHGIPTIYYEDWGGNKRHGRFS